MVRVGVQKDDNFFSVGEKKSPGFRHMFISLLIYNLIYYTAPKKCTAVDITSHNICKYGLSQKSDFVWQPSALIWRTDVKPLHRFPI